MKSSKTLLIANLVILALLIPGYFIFNNHLKKRNLVDVIPTPVPTSTDVLRSPQPDHDEQEKIYTAIDPKKLDIVPECLPSNHNFKWELLRDGEKLEGFVQNEDIIFNNPQKYNSVQGVSTFRGNNYRDSASYGLADIKEEKLEKIWDVGIGYLDSWTGVGWNGQPSIIKWDEELKDIMNISPNKKSKRDLKEVIYGTLDGKIYFLDLDDGTYTREPINVGAPLKGSVSVDPRGMPMLYSGQGINVVNGKNVPIGFRIYSLIDQKLLYFLDGIDKDCLRFWGAFDSTPLVHEKSDTMFECGENGLLYSIKLNTDYNPQKGSVSIEPDVTKYRYTSPVNGRLGVESSILAYRNFAYFADNSGTLQCIDLKTLSTVWVRNITDYTDSTGVIEDLGDENVYLYVANEVDIQGNNGYSYVRKIHALTGELIWEKGYQCSYSENNGGAMASPVLGKNDIDNLVIFNIARSYKNNGGKLIAFDKNTGDEVWVIESDFYCWSSPVAVYTPEGKSYIIQCDSGGYMSLIEGRSGKTLDKIPLQANIEGSPAIFEDMIVVGTRGQKIWGIKIK